jgi:S-adenosylmethionine-diacylglycerol 3-amino-3-carboxypropyl transferase
MTGNVSKWLQKQMFSSLVFNQVWEDFDVDKRALQICPDDTLICITSGGCNVLNSIVEGCGDIHACDINPAQNWLLELKIKSAQELNYADFWQLFGLGKTDKAIELYDNHLHMHLTSKAERFWKKKIGIFTRGFYDSGRFGFAKKILRQYIRAVCGNKAVERFLNSTDLEEQRTRYEKDIWAQWWRNPISRVVVASPICLVPFGASLMETYAIRQNSSSGFPHYLEMQIHHVLTEIPIRQNYFWQQVFLGRYEDAEHAPAYLVEANFQKLKGNTHKIHVHSAPLTQVLVGMDNMSISKFNLSDVMDWMTTSEVIVLWKQVLRTARPNSLILWRTTVPSFFLPAGLVDELEFRVAEANALSEQEKTGSYSGIFICSPKKK